MSEKKCLDLDSIKKPVAAYIDTYNIRFEEILNSKSKWINEAKEILLQSEGKRIRPILTTLMGCLIKENISDKTINGAIVLELIHTASLIHDDVIDQAKTRRGVRSLNSFFDNRVSVLIGDFLFASSLMEAVGIGDVRVMSLVGKSCRILTEGEICQMELADNIVLDESKYMDVIKDKTAELFVSCAKIACYTTDAGNEDLERLSTVAELIGISFQIRDDIFDYYSDDIGKPTGNDIREGKVTLPLLFALSNGCGDEKKSMIKILKDKSFTKENIDALITYAKNNGGIEYSYNKIERLSAEAKNLLSVYPDSVYKSSLLDLVDYISLRGK